MLIKSLILNLKSLLTQLLFNMVISFRLSTVIHYINVFLLHEITILEIIIVATILTTNYFFVISLVL